MNLNLSLSFQRIQQTCRQIWTGSDLWGSQWPHAGPSYKNDFIARVGAVVPLQLDRRMQLRAATGGGRRKACVNKTKWKGRSSIGRKVATRWASPSEQSLTSQILRRAQSTARRVRQVSSTPLGDVQSGAKTGHLSTSTQPPPVHTVVHFAVKCNSSHCGVKTEFPHKQRRSETRTNAGEQEQRAAGR